MSHPAFDLIRSQTIPALNVTLEDYRHRATGARHLHLGADDNNNAFLVAFLTVPEDSSGVAHILEHTTLCGSERYPVRDPFFMMTRRSLNTFMNAFTSSDWTAYPFASQNRTDFENLLQVYLDAVFFPRLEALDFAQEGHRLAFAKADDPSSPLVYKGIVFNEMKGAMSSVVQVLWHEISQLLYPTTTYHYNSGGDPAEIPKLTHAQLKAFHATHYHPSNAIFMTYGDRPASVHQVFFEDCALHRFSKLAVNLAVPDEQRYTAPIQHEGCYPLDGEDSIEHKTHIVLGWLLGHNTDPRALMNASLLSGVLLDDSASPLRHALETTALGDAPSPLCGLDGSNREMSFCCGLEGSDPEQADATEALIFQVLNQVANDGIPAERLESVLHQMELQQREITGEHFPYGLRLLVNALTPTIHGGDPLSALDIDPVLALLREDIKNPDFIKGLVRTLLLDNPHRVRAVIRPDPDLSQQRLQLETEQLAAIKASLSPSQQQQIIDQTVALEARQNAQDDPELLPKVTLADVAEDLKIATGSTSTLAGMPATWYAQGTNGMVYQQIIVDLPDLDEDSLDLLPLYCECLTEVGVGSRDYLATQAWQSAISGGIRAGIGIRGDVADVQQVRSLFSLGGKALARHQQDLSELLHSSFKAVRFDELTRLRELIAQSRVDAESSISSRGIGLATAAACRGMNPTGRLNHRWGGLLGIRHLKQLDSAIEDPAELQAFADKLQRLHQALCAAPRQLLVISEATQQDRIRDALTAQWQTEAPISGFNPLQLAPVQAQIAEAWAVNTQVNFIAKAYPTVPFTHPDAPVLMVLSDFLRNGYLHRAIREQGGAYGGNASYDSDTGAFRFISYRDPRLTETLADFDRALDWLQHNPHETRSLEEALLGIVARIDRPGSPAGEAKSAFFGQLNGRTPARRRAFRSAVLKVTLADLQRVGSTYLHPERASIAVLSNAQTLADTADRLGLHVNTL